MDAAVAAYQAGAPMSEILAASGFTRQGIYLALKSRGIPRNRTWTANSSWREALNVQAAGEAA